MYTNQKKSQRYLAQHFGCSLDLVRSEMIRLGIPVRKSTDATNAVKPSKDELHDLYCVQKLPFELIRKQLNCAISTVSKWVNEYNLGPRSELEVRHRPIAKDLIESCDNQWSIPQMSQYLKCSEQSLVYHIEEYNLPIDTSEYSTKFTSKGETEVFEFIKSFGFDTYQSNRSILRGSELDIIIPSKKIAVEYNGLKWHSTQYKDPSYHLEKTKAANKAGYRLIHIFEDEWKNKRSIVEAKLQSILGKSPKGVYARKCTISQIDTAKRKEFLEKYHIQGDSNGTINLCLICDNKVVAVMHFIDLKEQKYVLKRYATSVHVVGGFSKLLTHFIRTYNPKYIETFADLRWSSKESNVYKLNNFEHVCDSGPNYSYTKNFLERHTRHQLKHDLHKKINHYDSSLSETKNMLNNGYYQIFDCGNMKFVWRNK